LAAKSSRLRLSQQHGEKITKITKRKGGRKGKREERKKSRKNGAGEN